MCVVFIVFFLFIYFFILFCFKQKTAYEMRISDWSSDVCSSDLCVALERGRGGLAKPSDGVRLVAGWQRPYAGHFQRRGFDCAARCDRRFPAGHERLLMRFFDTAGAGER